ncbi:pyridoxal phosphate-dependent transferase [Zychaea mexicana]|uniref:pyridoxal phosphate-dependent transferase n=1 Tax=Zychaea mexicana TaxID=64656 RepID=UPI0022FEECD2|nr:pyridoxal phosphate-dependent transferase [Zychaea mexicana]KAI9494037.1 pyridoxal phosphate-dependent transferase [Zychaea mexicana]
MTIAKIPFGRALRSEFLLEEQYVPLNHGGYGACPRVVRSAMRRYQDQAEQNPDRWLLRLVFKHLKENRDRVAALVQCDSPDLTFTSNATSAINSVVRSGFLNPGEKILWFNTTAHSSVKKIMTFLEDTHKMTLVPVELQYPLSDQDVLDITRRAIEHELAKDPKVPIRLAVFDAISALPAVRVPYEAMIQLVREYKILSLVDGAHAIGQIPLNLREADPDFFISDCHKWLFVPRGCAILYVPKRNQNFVHSCIISREYKSTAMKGTVSTPFEREFAWPGATDFSPYLCFNDALDFRESLGGEEEIQKYCNKLARQGGQLVADALGTELLLLETKDEDEPTFAMVNVRLPYMDKHNRPEKEIIDIIFDKLMFERNTSAGPFKHYGKWYVRLCAQVYNDLDDFQYFAQAIQKVVDELEKENID